MKNVFFISLIVIASTLSVLSQTPTPSPSPRFTPQQYATGQKLEDIRMRDVCILYDDKTKLYYAVSSGRGPSKEGFRNAAVRVFTSKDLISWDGPTVIFQVPNDLWGATNITGIWAPEMHKYKDKFYLFLTFDTNEQFPEQWRNWRPRVKRGSQILVADSPLGPFKPFANHSTPPADMMTLDGSLWVEDGVPYMVFAHEWVQIKDGTIEMIKLKDDLSDTIGEPVKLFNGSDGPWARKSPEYSCYVTDGPYLYRSKSGKLFLIWSSFSNTGYTVGLAISDSGKLAGPWRQQADSIFSADGGHAMLFKRTDGQLMMVLHQPNKSGIERAKLFEMEDTGESLKIKAPFGVK